MTLISVLMPVYNVEEYLETAINSILNQTHSNIELICQDDGSTDNSLNKLKELANKDKRIKVLQPYGGNKGVIAARNALLEAAKGEYVAWMDSDDFCTPDRLELQLDFLEKNKDYAAVGTSIVLTDENLQPYKTQHFDDNPFRQAVDPEICCATILARSNAVKKAGLFREVFRPGGEDGDWLLKLADSGLITNINVPAYLYRQHSSSTSRYFAPIRRLGVLSRMAARVRRNGEKDPIEDMRFDPTHDNICDEVIIENNYLTPAEKTLALSLPLRERPPLISILLYFNDNHAEIIDCLRRIRAQEFKNYELIVFDDASKPPLDYEALQMHDLGVKFTYLNSEQVIGYDMAMRKMADITQGRFLVAQNAHDYMREDRLTQQLKALFENPELDAVGSSVNIIRLNGDVISSVFYDQKSLLPIDFEGMPSSLTVKREALSQEKEPEFGKNHGLVGIMKSDAIMSNMPDILYYSRELKKKLYDKDISGNKSLERRLFAKQKRESQLLLINHMVHANIRQKMHRFELTSHVDIAPDDIVALRNENDRLWNFLKRSKKTKKVFITEISNLRWTEWRLGQTSFFSMLGFFLVSPLSFLRLVVKRIIPSDGAPLQTLYFELRSRLLEQGISATGSYESSDTEGLRKCIDDYIPLVTKRDSGQLGNNIVKVNLIEFAEGERGFFKTLRWQLMTPFTTAKIIARVILRKLKASLRNIIMKVRNSLLPILPRGSFVRFKNFINRSLGGRYKVFESQLPAKINVAVYDTWGDLPDALHHLLPNGERAWKGVQFTPAADIDHLDKADYALILNHVGQKPVKINLPPNRIWFAMGEPPTDNHHKMHLAAGRDSRILTPAIIPPEEVKMGRNYVPTLCMTRTWSVRKTFNELKAMKELPRKTKELSWITSNLALLPGHRYRLAFLERIKGHLPLDLFGRGFTPIADKWDAMAAYKYSIAFENTIAPYYITEKIFDCWAAGCLPFYYGSPEIGKYFPEDSYIKIDPEDKFVVEKMKETIDGDVYKDRIAAITEARGLILEKYNMFAHIAEEMIKDKSAAQEPIEQWFYPVDVHF